MLGRPHFTSLLPLRLPHWRLNRVLEMVRHRPLPLRAGRSDDHEIRAYRRALLLLMEANDDEEKRAAACDELPAVCQAHGLYYSADFATRQQIEARLLTGESCDAIGRRFAVDGMAIQYYSKIFFDVTDALQNRDWIHLMIRGRLRDEQDWGCSCPQAQQGYAMRLFGYYGGPLVLDALTDAMALTEPPQAASQVPGWFDEVIGRIVNTKAAAAAATIELTNQNAMRLIRMAFRRRGDAASGENPIAWDAWCADVLQAIEPYVGPSQVEITREQRTPSPVR
jgi:hypothetical protein